MTIFTAIVSEYVQYNKMGEDPRPTELNSPISAFFSCVITGRSILFPVYQILYLLSGYKNIYIFITIVIICNCMTNVQCINEFIPIVFCSISHLSCIFQRYCHVYYYCHQQYCYCHVCIFQCPEN